MTQFVRAANPIWWLPDLTGASLNDQYYAFFLTNDLPYLPQTVYQDPNGLIPWSNPIQFQPSGTLPNNLYFDETLTYRIEIRQGPTQADPLIWLIQNFQAGQGITTSDTLISADNMITNPQFADIYFGGSITITTAGTYNLGPGWKLVLTGTGSTTVTQVANPGDSKEEGNPPYYLTIANSGWSSAILYQQFNNNGAIFAGGAIAVNFLAFATGSNQTVTVNYVPNGMSNTQTIETALVQTGNFQYYPNAFSPLNLSLNTNTGQNANVQIQFVLPPSGTISLTNVLIVGQSIPLSSAFNNPTDVPVFPETTYERIVDQEFHTYRTAAVFQSKKNLLTGWEFALNPWQFQNSAITQIGAQCQYIADQTILYQQGAGNLFDAGQAGNGFNFGLQVRAHAAGSQVNNQFAIIQYIDASTINAFEGQYVSCLVRAILNQANSIALPIKMRLIYQANAPSTLSSTEPIASWTHGSDPTFSSAWTVVVPPGDPIYTLGTSFANDGSTQNFPGYAFNKFLLPTGLTNMYVGIVIYTMANLDNTLAGPNSVYFDRISLTANDFALDAAPETYDESLRKCQYYYEKSYDTSTLRGTATFDNALSFIMKSIFSSPTITSYVSSFTFNFRQTKRTSPTMTFYSPNSGTKGDMYASLYFNGSQQSGSADQSAGGIYKFTIDKDAVTGLPNASGNLAQNGSAAAGWDAALFFHYTADATLGGPIT